MQDRIRERSERGRVPDVRRGERAIGTLDGERGGREHIVMTRDGAYIAPHGSPGLKKRRATSEEIERARNWNKREY